MTERVVVGHFTCLELRKNALAEVSGNMSFLVSHSEPYTLLKANSTQATFFLSWILSSRKYFFITVRLQVFTNRYF